MTFLPIVDRELRSMARRRSTYWTRIVFALIAIAGAFVVMSLAGVFQARTTGVGGSLFRFLAVMAFLFCALAGVFITSDCLSEEKREGTLGFLFLTDLRGYDVVLGKLMATSLNAFYGLLTIFPVLAITLTMGGVTHGEFWRMTLVFINTLFFSLAAGIFISSISRHDQRAMAGTFSVILLMAGALPLAQFVLTKLGVLPPHTLSLSSPLTAWQLAFDAGYRMSGKGFWNCLLITHAMAWVFLALASFLLPRIWQETPVIGWTRTNSTLLSDRDVARRAARRARFLDVNPVFWLTSRTSRTGSTVGLTCVLVAFGWLMNRVNQGVGTIGVSLLSLFLPLLVAVPIGLHACRFFAEARRNGGLELLLSTPLTVKEILRGQWLTLRRKYLAPLIAVLGVEVLLASAMLPTPVGSNVLSILAGSGLLLLGMVTLVTDIFTAVWVGMLVGLTARKPGRAPALTLLYAIVIPQTASLLCIPRLLIDIPLLFWARDKLYRELRALSSARYTASVTAHLSGEPTKNAPPVLRA
ncbi:MAG TPA: ABC transporter permease subunit [Verrucomicrobiae bacterium]|nr:ABC transporter permease subunit [Verrucomicrobiae bacterium]